MSSLVLTPDQIRERHRENYYARLFNIDDFWLKVVHGGRGGGKSWAAARAIARLCTLGEYSRFGRPLRCVVLRETLRSIAESAKANIENQIGNMYLPGWNKPTQQYISHGNGSRIFFMGMSNINEDAIKSLESVDIVWFEEAQRMSYKSWELLEPTIRKVGEHGFSDSEIWLTANRTSRMAVIEKIIHKPPEYACVIWANWDKNQFFTKKNNLQRLHAKEHDPENYAHIWEGQPDDAGATRKVLPFKLLNLCVEAWDKFKHLQSGVIHGGYDVSDTGVDRDALTFRQSSWLYHHETWATTGRDNKSFQNVHDKSTEHGAIRMFYDAGGVGTGWKAFYNQLLLQRIRPCYGAKPVIFNGKVMYPDKIYIRSGGVLYSNNDYFSNIAAQLGWNLRLRAENTKRLLEGVQVDPHKCLFINPKIPHLQDLLAHMNQPEVIEQSAGMRIEKQPRLPGQSKPPSPDSYDASILAFRSDVQFGLKAPVT